jgi:hypothetical protein
MKRSFFAVAVAALTLVAWRWHASPNTDGGPLAFDRLWIDHLPKTDKDQVKVFVALTQQPVGLFQTTSTWKGEYEVFQFEGSGGALRVTYPQTGDHEQVTVAGTACREHGMDYCLAVGGASRGAKQYYSMKGWELDGVADVKTLEARVDALLAARR